MSALALHIAAKDARQLRPWLGAFFAVVLLRAGLVAAGIDAFVPSPRQASALGALDTALGLLHLGLMVAIAVQLVHVDRLVGTTAFWPTRPVPRGSLLAAKLLTAVVSLVVVPFLLDALVLSAHHASVFDVLGAVAEDTFVRLAVVLPVMALAAVTADLSEFVIAGVGIFLGAMLLELVLTVTKVLPYRSAASTSAGLVVAAGLTMVGALGALVHQVFTRRTRRTVVLLALSGLLVLYVGHHWDTPFLQPPTGLQAGWLDPALIKVTLSPRPPAEAPSPFAREGRPWLVRAEYALSGAPPNLLLMPLSVQSVATFADGMVSRFDANDRRRASNSSRYTRLAGLPRVEPALGGVRLADTEPALEGTNPGLPIAALTRREFEAFSRQPPRFDTDVTIGGLAYVAYGPIPLRSSQALEAAGRRISILSAGCEPGRCTAGIVEVMPVFAIDLRRPSRVGYLLVNPSKHVALTLRQSGEVAAAWLFGRLMFPLLAQHLRFTRISLSAKAPDDAPGGIDAAWLSEAAVTMIEVRDIGSFTVRAKVVEAGARN